MQDEINDLVIGFIEDYKLRHSIQTKWRDPLLGFANAKDPIFQQLKQVVDEDHKLPQEMLENANSVISFFIPFNDGVVLSNSNGINASEKWAIAYVETNKVITELSKFLTNFLKDKKYNCVEIAPTHNFDKKKLKSYWSHKHAAYVAGLGKFGLHKMLITEKGCCGRLGSLITSAIIDATERNEDNYCLYFQDGSCTQCVDRCSFDALHIDSFDRHKCYEICLRNGQLYSNLGKSDMCGKCACGIPCSLKNPCK
ncbi:MAG: epoxyqueuosine reductase [Candidatus Lokiarchaeota archaeon]|nr:epoxyqueuosine reductase [Candidatus Lokiarchaeota archaeon]